VTDPAIDLVNGAVTSGPDLSVEVNGLKLPNPFVIGSGPPGTNYQVWFWNRKGQETAALRCLVVGAACCKPQRAARLSSAAVAVHPQG
jgi:hypothetical protein